MNWSGIEGAWWRLRPATWADEFAIGQHGRHPDSLWIGISKSAPPERAVRVLSEFMKGDDGDFGLVHLAVTKESDEIVGIISAKGRSAGVTEISYGIAPGWRGRGLATEMLRAVTAASRDEDPGTRYELIIDPQNLASVRVAEKCGYLRAGTRRSFVEATGDAYEDLLFRSS